jgi:small neutral amino acid transporter SnatA (MarC family)
METKELLVTFLSVGAGVFSVMASILNWDFFFESRKAQTFIKLFGRNGARIFYIILGLFLFFIAYKIQTK